MGRSASDEKVSIHQSSREKREYLLYLKPTIDLVSLHKKTGIKKEIIDSAFEPSKTKRKTWLRNKRKKYGIFKTSERSTEKLITFLSFEKKLALEFNRVTKKEPHFENILSLYYDVQFYTPGSGLTHTLIRYIGITFFKKECVPAWND